MQRYWTPRQVQAFVALFYVLEALPPHYALFATGILLGLRPGELCALQWCDLSADGTKLRVWRSITEEQVKNREKDPELPRFTLGLAKEGTDDWMDLPDVLQQILKRHREEAGVCEEGWIFPNDSGSYLTPVALRGRWYATQKRKGGWVKTGGYYTIQALVLEHTAGTVDLHYITPYGYRHTAATYELNTGGDSTSAARLLRHSRSTGTQLIDRNYGEILAERAEARLARVNEGFAALRKVVEKDAA